MASNFVAKLQEQNVRHDQDCDYCLKQAKGLLDKISKDADAFENWIVQARSKCPPGEWAERLRKAGINRSTAYYVLRRVSENIPEDGSDTQSDCAQIGRVTSAQNKDLGKSESLFPAAPFTSPNPSTASPRGGAAPAAPPPSKRREREPGDEPPDRIDRALKALRTEVDEAALIREVARAQREALLRKIDALASEVRALWQKPERPKMEPFRKACRDCGTDCLAAKSSKGKFCLWVESSNGKFDLVDGVMEHCKGGAFLPHHLLCVKGKRKCS